MPQCDRCDGEVPISTADASIGERPTASELRDIHTPDEEPFAIIEGAFASWTPELDVANEGDFSVLLCRTCTRRFVEWLDNPDISPETAETRDHGIKWGYTNRG